MKNRAEIREQRKDLICFLNKESGKKSVLYVDDEERNLEAFKANFRKSLNVHVARNANDAVEIMRNHHIDVLLADQRMPKFNGTQLIDKVKDEFPNIACLVLTAYPEEVKKSPNIFRILPKPFDIKEICQSVIDAYHFNLGIT